MDEIQKEKAKKEKKKKRRIRIISAIIAVVLILVGVSLWYLNDSYPPTEDALKVLKEHDASVTVTEKSGEIIFAPKEPQAGLVFYPGAKVEYEAYAPLMEAIAESGIMCVLVEMPMNFAIFDTDRADAVLEEFPEIKHWYLAGHSLGGAMAASYISKNYEKYDGLILLAAYSTKDLTESGLKVLSVYGSEDQVLGKEKYESNKKNLPANYLEFVIEGGCHAYFGDYGEQRGDGTPTIRRDEQIEETVDAILMLLQEN